MPSELPYLTVRDLVDGYHDNDEGGVADFASKLGRLNVKGKRTYGRIVVQRK